MTDMVIMPGSHYQAICDAVRAKTGDTAALRSGELAAAIAAASGVQTERGSFVTDSTLSISIPCGFEPDAYRRRALRCVLAIKAVFRYNK